MTLYPLKSIVLAAGFGTRLKPLTLFRPKPLFPFYGPNLLEIAILQLSGAGFGPQDIAVNAHHLAYQIVNWGKSLENVLNFPLRVSVEKEILGTGGFINPLRSWIGQDHLLVYNGDTITDVDIREFVDFHFKNNFLASMILLPNNLPNTSVVIAAENEVKEITGSKNKGITTFPGATQHTFSGIHILSPRFMARLPRDHVFLNIIDFYQLALAEGERIGSYIHSGFWHDMGTPEGYFKALTAFHLNRSTLGQRLNLTEIGRRLGKNYIITQDSEGAIVTYPANLQVPGGVKFKGPCFLMEDVVLEPHTFIGPNTIGFGGARFVSQSQYGNTILTNDAKLNFEFK